MTQKPSYGGPKDRANKQTKAEQSHDAVKRYISKSIPVKVLGTYDPRLLTGTMSATVPPAFVKGTPPTIPANNLKAKRASALGDRPHAAVNMVKRTLQTW